MFIRRAVLCLASIIALAVSAPTARADETTGTQLAALVTLDKPLTTKVGLRAQVAVFGIPSEGKQAAFLYLGPTWKPFDDDRLSWEVSLKGVAALNFFEGQDAFGPSLASYLSINKNRFSLFTLFDGYFASGQHAWYGFYALDARAVPWLNTGVHVEHIGTAATYGPHVGLNNDSATIEAQLHLADETRALRVQLSLRF